MKTVDEWSKAFDLLWNNIASGKAPGLNEYEKSIILTEAENALVKDYLSKSSNVWKEGYDDSARRQSDFKSLMMSVRLSQVTDLDNTDNFNTRPSTRYFIFPSDVLIVINEELKVSDTDSDKYYVIVPVSSDEYSRLMMAPYKFPPKDQVWRLISHTGTDGEVSYQTIELIGKFVNSMNLDYRMRYIRKPKPIVLKDLVGGLSVDGETTSMTCELPEHLHDEILQRAVQIAKISWIDGKSDSIPQR